MGTIGTWCHHKRNCERTRLRKMPDTGDVLRLPRHEPSLRWPLPQSTNSGLHYSHPVCLHSSRSSQWVWLGKRAKILWEFLSNAEQILMAQEITANPPTVGTIFCTTYQAPLPKHSLAASAQSPPISTSRSTQRKPRRSPRFATGSA